MKTIDAPDKIVFMSTIPPTQWGIAGFTEDTIRWVSDRYGKSILCEIAEITFKGTPSSYSSYHLPSTEINAYKSVADDINQDSAVKLVHIQHEFGSFGGAVWFLFVYFSQCDSETNRLYFSFCGVVQFCKFSQPDYLQDICNSNFFEVTFHFWKTGMEFFQRRIGRFQCRLRK